MSLILDIASFLQLALLFYLSLACLYFLLFAISGKLYKRKWPLIKSKIRRIAVLIPAYKEDEVIYASAINCLKQDYPEDMFDVVVIADQLKPETLSILKELPISIIKVDFSHSSKAKALNYAMEKLPSAYYDIATILDADNLMMPDFLLRVNDLFNRGALVVQGHRIAKNHQTHLALLDGISEEVNNHIYRKGHYHSGLSSALIGSGMGIQYDLYKECMAEIESYAEDKELEFQLLQRGIRIHYEENAFVFDEKTSNRKDFIRQRSRWILNQLSYVKKYFKPSCRQFFHKANIDLFDKLLQQLLPPRILYIGVTCLFTLLTWFFNPLNISLVWTSIFVLSIITFRISIPVRFYNKKTFKAILHLPLAFIYMVCSLLSAKNASRSFGATRHHVTDILAEAPQENQHTTHSRKESD